MNFLLLLFIAIAIGLPFAFIYWFSRTNKQRGDQIIHAMEGEPCEVVRSKRLFFEKTTPLEKQSFWTWKSGRPLYNFQEATVIMHANAVMVLGEDAFSGMKVKTAPFYIRFNENNHLMQRLQDIHRVELVSLQSMGETLEITFEDPNYPNPINMVIRDMGRKI